MNFDQKTKIGYVPAKMEIVYVSDDDLIVTSGGDDMGTENEDWN